MRGCAALVAAALVAVHGAAAAVALPPLAFAAVRLPSLASAGSDHAARRGGPGAARGGAVAVTMQRGKAGNAEPGRRAALQLCGLYGIVLVATPGEALEGVNAVSTLAISTALVDSLPPPAAGVKRLFLCRHGQTELNRLGKMQVRPARAHCPDLPRRGPCLRCPLPRPNPRLCACTLACVNAD